MENDIYFKNNNEDLISSGFSWFLTCICATLAPSLLSCIYLSLSRDELVNVFDKGNDIILILLSISCGLLTLCRDGTKLMKRKVKINGQIVSMIIFILSGTYYFFNLGAGESPKNLYIFLLVYVCIVYCTFKGLYIGYKHDRYFNDKNIKRRLIEKTIEDLNTDEKKELIIDLIQKLDDDKKSKLFDEIKNN